MATAGLITPPLQVSHDSSPSTLGFKGVHKLLLPPPTLCRRSIASLFPLCPLPSPIWSSDALYSSSFGVVFSLLPSPLLDEQLFLLLPFHLGSRLLFELNALKPRSAVFVDSVFLPAGCMFYTLFQGDVHGHLPFPPPSGSSLQLQFPTPSGSFAP